MSKIPTLEECKARKRLIKKAKLGAAVVVVGGAYVWHRRKLDAVITMSQNAVQDTMWGSFDEGIRYGIQLCKDLGDAVSAETLNNAVSAQDLKDASQYAFGAFDRPA
jgi:hypothetical protein